MATQTTSSLAYRRAALQHASTVGLVIALYDTLVGNLRRAAAAIERNDIQTRCAELVHGFNVLQQLELMVDIENGGETAVRLRRFYSLLRKQMLNAQFKLSPAILYEQVDALITVRTAWQKVDARGTRSAEIRSTEGEKAGDTSNMQGADPGSTRSSFSCLG
jgi:flagellar protein FliS